jgi:hypothetical protein
MSAHGLNGLRCAAELRALARRVDRLVPSHRDPERYHEEKAEIVAALRAWRLIWGRQESRWCRSAQNGLRTDHAASNAPNHCKNGLFACRIWRVLAITS